MATLFPSLSQPVGLYSAKSGSETGTPQPPTLEAHGLLRHSGDTSKNGTSGTRRGVHSANNCGISSSDVSAHVEALGATQSPKLKASGRVKKKYQNKISLSFLSSFSVLSTFLTVNHPPSRARGRPSSVWRRRGLHFLPGLPCWACGSWGRAVTHESGLLLALLSRRYRQGCL